MLAHRPVTTLIVLCIAAVSAYAAPGDEPRPGQRDPEAKRPARLVEDEAKKREDKQEAGGGPKVGQPAPEWNLKTPDGKAVKLSELKGKVVVMDFWASWCGPCVAAMPSIQRIHEKFKDKPVAVYGLNTGDNQDPAKFMQSKGLTYNLLVKAESAGQAYAVSGIPAFFIVGQDGTLLYSAVGYSPSHEATMIEVITKALETPAAKPEAGSGKPGDATPAPVDPPSKASGAKPDDSAKPKPDK